MTGLDSGGSWISIPRLSMPPPAVAWRNDRENPKRSAQAKRTNPASFTMKETMMTNTIIRSPPAPPWRSLPEGPPQWRSWFLIGRFNLNGLSACVPVLLQSSSSRTWSWIIPKVSQPSGNTAGCTAVPPAWPVTNVCCKWKGTELRLEVFIFIFILTEWRFYFADVHFHLLYSVSFLILLAPFLLPKQVGQHRHQFLLRHHVWPKSRLAKSWWPVYKDASCKGICLISSLK